MDPYDGVADIGAGLIRAVGDPAARFQEDALRMLRGVRFAATLGFELEAVTLAAIREHGAADRPPVGRADPWGAGPAAPRPLGRRAGFRLLADTGVLATLFPDLDAQRGIPQNKVPGEDLWAHSLRTVDASAATPNVRLAALLHDIGKPATLADGRFVGHDTVGARMATALLDRLHGPRERTDRRPADPAPHVLAGAAVVDAAVRRFLVKVGPDLSTTCCSCGRPTTWDPGYRPMPAACRVPAADRRAAGGEGGARPGALAVDGNELMRSWASARGRSSGASSKP